MSPAVEQPPASSGFWALLRRLTPMLRPHRALLAVVAALTLALAALFQAGPLLIRHAVDANMAGRDMVGLYWTVLAFVAAQALTVGATYAQRLLVERIAQDVLQGIKERLFAHTIGLSLSFFDRHTVGRLMARLESDAESLRQLLTFTGTSMVGDGLAVVASIGVMLSIHAGMSMVVAGIFTLLVLLSVVFTRTGQPIFKQMRERAADVSSFLQEHFQAVPVLQAYRREETTCRRLDQVNESRFKAVVRGAWLWNTYFNILFLSEAVGTCATLAYGAHLLERHAITVGAILLYIEYLRRFFMPIFRLSEQLNVVQRAVAAGDRVFELLGEAPRVVDPVDPVEWHGLSRGIEFDNVSFAYREGEPVLRNVSFHLPRGQRWAVVGATGSGKSTLINLLLRFYDVQAGAVRIDGVDVRRMRQQDLRRRTALVLQDIAIFPGTVRDNIVLGDDGIDDARIERAAEATALARTLSELPHRFDTELAERGANLSTGQRQLLSFARALAHDPEILILDEATAAVDPETERAIQAALETLLLGRTALMVAHRLATVRFADRILVVDRGEIVEQGTHDELLAKRGAYYRLYRLQMAEVAA